MWMLGGDFRQSVEDSMLVRAFFLILGEVA
jgi:hypothetical protein